MSSSSECIAHGNVTVIGTPANTRRRLNKPNSAQKPDTTVAESVDFTVHSKLVKLCLETSQQIEQCGNACDAYMKQGRVTKFRKALHWKQKFSEFLAAFAKRQEDFNQAILLETLTTVRSIAEK